MEDPQLFVVRVWRQRGFRASARAAEEAEAHWFTDAGELAFFLALPLDAPERAAPSLAVERGEADEPSKPLHP